MNNKILEQTIQTSKSHPCNKPISKFTFTCALSAMGVEGRDVVVVNTINNFKVVEVFVVDLTDYDPHVLVIKPITNYMLGKKSSSSTFIPYSALASTNSSGKSPIFITGDKVGDVNSFETPPVTEPNVKFPYIPKHRHLFGHTASMITTCTILKVGVGNNNNNQKEKYLLLTGDRDEKVRVGHFPDYQNTQNFLMGHKGYITSVGSCSNQENNLVVTSSGDKSIRLWDVFANGQSLAAFETEGIPSNIAISPDGKIVSYIVDLEARIHFLAVTCEEGKWGLNTVGSLDTGDSQPLNLEVVACGENTVGIYAICSEPQYLKYVEFDKNSKTIADKSDSDEICTSLKSVLVKTLPADVKITRSIIESEISETQGNAYNKVVKVFGGGGPPGRIETGDGKPELTRKEKKRKNKAENNGEGKDAKKEKKEETDKKGDFEMDNEEAAFYN